jgi:hypothetical protein
MNVETLAAEWLAAKRAELEANTRRLDIEKELLKLVPSLEEGSQSTVLGNGWKLKTTGKLTYKAEIDKLLALCASWPAEAKPVKTKVEADESLLKAIRHDRPDLWRQIAPAITVKPAKTYIVIEEVSSGI